MELRCPFCKGTLTGPEEVCPHCNASLKPGEGVPEWLRKLEEEGKATAGLPFWVSEVLAEEGAPSTSEEPSDEGAELPPWMSPEGEEGPPPKSAEEEPPSEPSEEAVPDWMAQEIGEEERAAPSPEEEGFALPAWMLEEQEEAPPSETAGEEEEVSQEETGLPPWLTLAGTESRSEESEGEELLPGWLAEEPEKGPETTAGEEAEAAPEEPAEEPALPPWLAEEGEEAEEIVDLLAPEEEAAEAAPEEPAEEPALPSWLAEEGEGAEEEEEAEPAPEEPTLPPWLAQEPEEAEEEEAEPTPEEPALPPWLAEEGEEAEEIADLLAPEGEEAEAAPEEPAEEPALPSWLAEEGEGAEEIADLLTPEEEPGTEEAEAVPEGEAAGPELPEWFREILIEEEAKEAEEEEEAEAEPVVELPEESVEAEAAEPIEEEEEEEEELLPAERLRAIFEEAAREAEEAEAPPPAAAPETAREAEAPAEPEEKGAPPPFRPPEPPDVSFLEEGIELPEWLQELERPREEEAPSREALLPEWAEGLEVAPPVPAEGEEAGMEELTTAAAPTLTLAAPYLEAGTLMARILEEGLRPAPPQPEAPTLPRWRQALGRTALPLLLLLLIGLSLWASQRVAFAPVPPSPDVVQVFEALDRLGPEDTVLVAFEWDSMQQGEMLPLARVLVGHLLHKGVRVYTFSTQAQGAAWAQEVLETEIDAQRLSRTYGQDYQNLGFRPGGLLALPVLRQGLWQPGDVDFLGLPLPDPAPRLPDLAHVVVLAGDGVRAQIWIEQVAPYVRTTVAVPSALGPRVLPYRTRGLLRVLIGLEGAQAYEQLLEDRLGFPPRPAWNARLYGQLSGRLFLVLVLLLAGLAGLLERGRSERRL